MTTTPSKNILITGASSGFGALTAHALADAGHTVYAGMRGTTGHNADAVTEAEEYSRTHSVRLIPIEMDVSDQASVDTAVAGVLDDAERIDVVMHNAGHMVLGASEAFTADQLASVYDTNVISTQRVNQAVLPHMRAQRDGLVIWVGSSSARGGTPPFLGPYFAAKAAEDALAVSYAAELAGFSVDTSIIVPGSYTTGTNHFAHAGTPELTDIADAYAEQYPNLMDDVNARLAKLAPADADPAEVAAAIVRVVDTPKGERPFRVHIDPADDGAEVVFEVGDRIRREFYSRIDLTDMLTPAAS